MQKIMYRKLSTQCLFKNSLLIALIYCILFNTPILAYNYSYYKSAPIRAILELGKDFLYVYIFATIVFFSLTIHKIIFSIGITCLFLSSAIVSYYLFFFQVSPDEEAIRIFFGTDYNEIAELISIRLIIWLLFNLLVCIYIIKRIKINGKNNSLFCRLMVVACLLLTIGFIIFSPYRVLQKYLPMQYLHNTYLYFSEKKLPKHKIDISNQFTFIDKSSENIKVILIIGESARFDHFGINGYSRNTTPYLQTVDNLVSFLATSCSNLTYTSVPCMLSRHSANKFKPDEAETSILSILTRLKFDTSWIATQSLKRYMNNIDLGTVYDEVLFNIVPGGSALYKLNSHDEIMIPYIKDILQRNNKQFIVVHTSGSHWSYTKRYPRNFAMFLPECDLTGKNDPSTCTNESLVNSYDNSILYTDFFIYNLISLVKDENAFLIYASDHGESLGENGRLGHAGDVTVERTSIPFFFWFSNKFAKNYPLMIKNIYKYQKQYNNISHDNIFHSILDCLNINSDLVDKKLSICSGGVDE